MRHLLFGSILLTLTMTMIKVCEESPTALLWVGAMVFVAMLYERSGA